MSDRNQQIIEEFRANDSVVSGHFTGKPLLLLHSIGAKSGQKRINPVAAFEDDDTLYVIASKDGAPTNPDWYHNIVANPTVEVEYGTERFQAQAAAAEEPERTELYNKAASQFAAFADYKEKTDRVIPVVTLSRTA